jgi:hypothetical protein
LRFGNHREAGYRGTTCRCGTCQKLATCLRQFCFGFLRHICPRVFVLLMIRVVLGNTVVHISRISGRRSLRAPDCMGTLGRINAMLISARLQRKQKHRLPDRRIVWVFVTRLRTPQRRKLLARQFCCVAT